MSDLFHESVPDEFIDQVFAVMALCPQHGFQCLTKRPERMAEYCGRPGKVGSINVAISKVLNTGWGYAGTVWPLRNVWLGVSVEDQPTANERIPLLLRTPAAVRFVSYEPALKEVSFDGALVKGYGCNGESPDPDCIECRWKCNTLDWIIVGGESGPWARPFDIAWAREIIIEGRVANVPVFIKQLGRHPWDSARPANIAQRLHLKDSHGGNWDEWPQDLRVREFPK